MHIGLITTLHTNFGDDLIREGICQILQGVFKRQEITFITVNKNQPLMVYPDWHPIPLTQSLTRLLPRGRKRVQGWAQKFFHRFGLSRFDNCDLILQCGTPVLWPGCFLCGWAEPLWHQVVGRLSRKGVPVLNLGAGSCYPWEKQLRPSIDESEAIYLRKIYGYCRVTTVRDRLAQNLFESLGHSCPLIPCPALLSGRPFINSQTKGDIIIINYMEKGGHFDWGQDIDPHAWRDILREVVDRIRPQHPVLFLCHNQKEYELAFAVNPKIPRFLPKDSHEYFSVLSQAKIGLCNRIHAVIALAGIGIPSVAVGTDTRLLTVEAVDLPYLYVKEATVDGIEETLRHLLRGREIERERLLMLHEQTWARYVELIEESVSP